MGTSKNVFAVLLSILVLAVTILALLGIWDIIDWNYLRQYFWKSIQSLIILLISAVAIYLIQQIFRKDSGEHKNMG